MRIIKDADVRKAEILDAAGLLFAQKGYDATTISDILDKLGVARGLVYYHFKSKEDILDALIERTATGLLTNAKEIAANKNVPVLERLLQTLTALIADSGNREIAEITEQMHKPQNALMHQKSHHLMMEGIPPILAEIVEDGIAEGLFNTPYPYESVEMIVAYDNAMFGEYSENFTQEEFLRRIDAFIFNLERLFGAQSGTFAPIEKLFGIGGGEHDETRER